MSNPRSLTSGEIGDAVTAFQSELCPACGTEKYWRLETFCADCQGRLPPYLKEGMSDRSRYTELFRASLTYLQREVIRQSPAGPMAQADGSGPEETEI